MNKADNKTKAPGRRGSYPCYSLVKAIEVTEIVRSLGGNRQGVPKSSIAQQLNLADSSPALGQLLGAARCFGLVEGRGESKLTPLAMEYFYPTEEAQKRNALLAAIARPLVFEKLIKRFDGNKLPEAEVLANVLHRELKVPESWRTRIASIFRAATREAGVLDQGGYLRYEATRHVTPAIEMAQTHDAEEPAQTNERPQKSEAQADLSSDESAKDNVWVFSHGESIIKLQTSTSLSIEAWRKLEQYVNVLKPEEKK